MIAKIVDFLRFSGLVKRYHTWPTIQQQNVAEHTWQVMRIYVQVFGLPNSVVWFYMLHHDSPEVFTGDPPFPIKRDNPDLKFQYDRLEADFVRDHGLIRSEEISTDDRTRVKVCDLLEMWEFGLVEERMGNRLAENITVRTLTNVLAMAEFLGPEDLARVRKYVKTTEEKLT